MAKYVSEDGVKAIRDWVKVHDNKSLYNLGYYDTYDASTNTITRQTGYVDLGTFDWALDGNNRFFNRCGLDFEMPSTSDTKPNIISAKYSAITEYEYVQRTKIGISIAYSLGIKTILIYDTNYNDVNAFKSAMQGVILQYKLATPLTTEKVEKNHYSLYNQRFILEHNKSEAERSANLFDNNLITFNNDDCYSSGYPNFYPQTFKAGTYTFSYSGITKTSGGWTVVFEDGTSVAKDLTQTAITFTLNSPSKLYFYCNQNMNGAKFMLNEGSTPLPYQPYEGKVVHEKELKDNYVDKTSAQEISGIKKFTNGINVGSRDDTGIFVANNNSTVHIKCFSNNIQFSGKNGSSSYGFNALLVFNYSGEDNAWNFEFPNKSGTIALTRDFKTINGNSIVGSGDLSISGTIPIYGVSHLYRHDYEIENQVGDTIYVHCWSTQNTKIKLYDITAYAFSNIQVYNTSNEEAINVLKWETSGFYYIADNGTIAGNSYTVIHYYINGEPTTY